MEKTRVAVVVLAALGLGAAPSSAEAPSRPRQVVVPYEAGVGTDCERKAGCVVLVPRKGEKYVNFTVKDVAGLRVYGTVTHARRSSPQVFGEGSEFCGDGSYPATPGKPVYLYFENHLGSWHHCPGSATRGVVQASFVTR